MAGTLVVTGGAVLVSTATAGPAAAWNAPHNQVTLCHRTNSDTNPYVRVTVDVSAAGIQGGHADHTGPIWNPTLKAQGIKWGDIIPPTHSGSFSYPGLNWTAQGQAWWNNGCEDPGGGYPPPPIPTTCSFAEMIGVGSSVTVSVTCKFAPSSKITITLNGHPYAAATAPPTGFFVETFTATSPHNIALNGGPAVSTSFGALNTFVASGTNPGGGTNVATTYVVVTPHHTDSDGDDDGDTGHSGDHGHPGDKGAGEGQQHG